MIKNRLKTILHDKGISVVQLSKDTGLTRNAIYNFMGNLQQTYNLNTMNTICNYLNMNISDIIYYSENDMTFTFDKDSGSISFDKIKVNDDANNVCRFDIGMYCYKNNIRVSDLYLMSYFFMIDNSYYFGYNINDIHSYGISIINNKNNIVAIVKDAIKYIISYTEGIKFAKQQFSSNKSNNPFINISDNIIDKYSGFSKSKNYSINIIPLFNLYDEATGKLNYTFPSIKSEIRGSNDNDFSLENVKNNKKYIHGTSDPFDDKVKNITIYNK